MGEFVMAPVGAYRVVITEGEGTASQARRVEGWPVIAFDGGGAPLLMDAKHLAPVSEIVDRYDDPEWHLEGGAPQVHIEWSR